VDKDVSRKAREAYQDALGLLQAEKYEPAIQRLTQAISLQTNYVHAHTDLAVGSLKIYQLDRAVETLRRAIELNGTWYLPQLNLGIVLNRLRKHAEAAEVLTKLQESH